MPILRAYANKKGFYVADYLRSTGNVVWQIGEEGLKHLANYGVSNDGNRFSGWVRDQIRARKLIWFRGDHPGERSPEKSSVLAGVPSGLFEGLRDWGRQGGVAELQQLLQRSGKDHRLVVFSSPFLVWLRGLDDTRPVRDLADLSAIDFHDLAAPRTEQLQDALHEELVRQGEIHILWQFGRIVGRVAAQRDAGTCPPTWVKQFPLLQMLFAQLGDLAAPPRVPRQTRQRRPRADAGPAVLGSGHAPRCRGAARATPARRGLPRLDNR